MNRFDYSGGLKPPQEISDVTGRIVRFYIPGSGGCYLGVAQIDDDFKLSQNSRIGKTGFVHYEQIHSNHINWKTNDIRWHGIKIGRILEGGSPAYYSPFSEQGIENSNREIQSIDFKYSKKYPTAQ